MRHQMHITKDLFLVLTHICVIFLIVSKNNNNNNEVFIIEQKVIICDGDI